jgi:cation:H+ antiporter
MLLAFLSLGAGLLLLYLGAEALVRGSAAFARRVGLTPLVIGLTVVAFGTSAPELAVSVDATLEGSGGLAAGNVIGSNISNIALILGVSALISPLRVHAQVIRVDIPLMILISLLVAITCIDGSLGRLEGAALTLGLAAYLSFAVMLARRETSLAVRAEFGSDVPEATRSVWVEIVLMVSGLGLLLLGAEWLVDGAVTIARRLGVSDAVIGLTLVALGTSLPELATSIVAALKRHTDLAVGNIIGSNIFNLLGILGIAAWVRPLQLDDIHATDWLAMIAVSVLILPLARSDSLLKRWEAVLLLIVYAGYLLYLSVRA